MLIRTAFAALLLLWVSLAAASNGAGTEIRQLLSAYLRAWSRADAHALASAFEPNGDFVSPDGAHAEGRRAIESFYSGAFERGYAHSEANFAVRKIRLVDPHTAIVDGVWTIANAHDPSGARRAPERGLAVVVLGKTPDGWKIIALREQDSATDLRELGH